MWGTRIRLRYVQQSAIGPIRPWGEVDDVTALTAPLHIAYKPLMDAGMQYVAGRQDDATNAAALRRRATLLGHRRTGAIGNGDPLTTTSTSRL